jgi:hypothetical protein
VLRRRAGAALPGLLWIVVALQLGSKRTEGDLVVPGDLRGVAFLLAGALAAALVVGATPVRRPAGSSSSGGG